MIQKIKELLEQTESFTISSLDELEQFRLKYLSKKGEIAQLFADFKNVPAELKKEVGLEINRLKQKAQEKYDQLKESFEESLASSEGSDLTRPGEPLELGSRHPA